MCDPEKTDADGPVAPPNRRRSSASAATAPGSEDPFRLFFENSADAVFLTDDDGRFLEVNAAACELFGYSSKRMLRLRLRDVALPEASDAAATESEPYLKTGRETGVFRCKRPDNAVRIASYSMSRLSDGRNLGILRDITGQVDAAVGSVQDVITWHLKKAENEELVRTLEALRQRQAEIEVLNQRLRRAMTETHHRVKNNLQLISALIDLQKQSGQEMVPMSDIVQLGHNIQALGIIHDILTTEAKSEDESASISVKGVLEQFLPLLASSFGERRLRSRLEEVFLPGKYATSVALIANELVSNAVKHGRNDMELTLHAEGDTATLEVCDDGPGFPEGFDPRTAAHTGLELIENIARHDLDARISYENRSQGGARVVLTFPLRYASLL